MLLEVKQAGNASSEKLQELTYENKKILVAKIEDKYYAVSGKCTHLGCDLIKGEYSQGVITCPCHGSQFSIVDGRVIEWIEDWPNFVGNLTKKIGLAKGLKTYKTVVKEEKLYIEI